MDLYVHRTTDERVELRVVETTVTIAEAVTLEDGEHVWIEETEEEIDTTMTIEEAGIGHRGHVHVNRCREVAVAAHHNGVTKERTFHPSARIERVFDWASGEHGFDLSPADRTEHTLEICDTTIRPDDADHVGSFVGEHCLVCFNLVPKHRFEG